MPEFDAITSKWQASGGSAGKGGSGGGGHPGQGGTTTNGGMSSAGKANGGKANGGKANGGKPGTGGGGVGGTGDSGPGGEAGSENGGNGGATEGGATGVGGTGTGGTAPNGGEGGALCEPGFETCPGLAECSTNLAVGDPVGSTVTNCGACGVSCSTANVDTAACASGVCQPTCSANYGDCNTAANDGCETDLTTPTWCGSCEHACSKTGAATRACTSGACAPTCGARYLDCNVDDGTSADDGCETFVDALAACGETCNGGGTACNPDQVCNTGVCGAAAGLIQMNIPFSAAGQGQRYADVFAAPDLTGQAVIVRLYAPGAANGFVQVFLTDNGNPTVFGAMTQIDFSVLSAGWTDIVVDTGQPDGSFDTADVHQVSFDFYTTTSTSNPTVVYLDAVWSSDVQINDTFDTTTGSMIASTRLVVAGSTFGWVASVP
jgi:hypothetical protein